ncbi:MAG: beta-aspartyl-peptidase [Thermoleophilia bacterium]|nr:beta-aspartyl-peptidase [Thermoleophilia bacterium]
MKLEVHGYTVSKVEFGPATTYEAGTLAIDRAELTSLLAEDPRLTSVGVDITAPGSSTRISNVLDVLEPRVKPSTGSYFPGMLGPLGRAGQGVTNILRGINVLEIGSGLGFFGGLLDMSGPGAALTPFADAFNVCVTALPSPGVGRREYGQALKNAGLKASVYLASATFDLEPDVVEVFEPDGTSGGGAAAALPAVGYLLQLHSHAEVREPFVYGDNPRRYYPTILHPNEVIDGAIVCGAYDLSVSLKTLTYSFLNHPVILGMLRRHDRDLDFRGVVVAPEPVSLADKHRTAMMSAALLKDVLKVDGVVITKEGGGHTDVDLMENCEACESAGIKTVLVDNEWLTVDGSGESPLIAVSDRADAMVSVGNVEEIVELPPMERLIGGDDMISCPGDLRQTVSVQVWTVAGAISQVGSSYLTTVGR